MTRHIQAMRRSMRKFHEHRDTVVLIAVIILAGWAATW